MLKLPFEDGRKSFVKECSPGPGAHYPIDLNKQCLSGAKIVS